MLLIGFCVNLLVAGIYYAFAGISYGIRQMFHKPDIITKLLISPVISTTHPPKMKKDSITNKSVGKKNSVCKETVRHADINKDAVETSRIRDRASTESGEVVNSLRCTLREGMARHDKTGRISKMFTENMDAAQNNIREENYLTI